MVDDKMAKVNTVSEVVSMDEKAMAIHAAREMPNIASVHVSKSSKVHIGPKIVAVNQTVENKEMIKGHIFGLELVSVRTSRRLRCSVAVFLCWALLIASGLTAYLVYLALNKHQVRLDIDLPLPKYIWTLLKNTNKTERLSCLAAVCALTVCISLIVFFTAFRKTPSADDEEKPPHEWRITREMWLAQEYTSFSTTDEFNPLKLVVVWHTTGSECHSFGRCATELRNLQSYFLTNSKYDIPYSFLIGNDGRVYEGRGWNREGAHTKGYNRCSIGIGFMGDYREELPVYTKVTPAQINRTLLLLQEGVDKGYLVPDFRIVSSHEIRSTEEPTNLVKALKKLDHYDHNKLFVEKNCTQIHSPDFKY